MLAITLSYFSKLFILLFHRTQNWNSTASKFKAQKLPKLKFQSESKFSKKRRKNVVVQKIEHFLNFWTREKIKICLFFALIGVISFHSV